MKTRSLLRTIFYPGICLAILAICASCSPGYGCYYGSTKLVKDDKSKIERMTVSQDPGNVYHYVCEAI